MADRDDTGADAPQTQDRPGEREPARDAGEREPARDAGERGAIDRDTVARAAVPDAGERGAIDRDTVDRAAVPDASIPAPYELGSTGYGLGGSSAEFEPDLSEFEDTSEIFLGGEAAVPPGEYGPPIPSMMPDLSALSSEFRELQRRFLAQLTPAFPLESRRELPLGFLWKRYRKLAMRDRSDVVDEFGRDPVFLSRIEPLLDFLYYRYFRVQVVGIDNVPGVGRALLVANHSGALPYDGAILMHALRRDHPRRRDARPLVEDFVFHFPYLGTFVNRLGGVRACQENAERLLSQDRVVAVFPEGVKGIGKLYKDRYRLQRFGRGGFVKLALRTRTPIVPVAIVGAEEIHPMVSRARWLSRPLGIPYLPVTPTFPWLGPLGLLPLPSKWTISFGIPMDVAADHGPEAADSRVLVGRLAEQIRARIQRMVDDILARRRSVLRG